MAQFILYSIIVFLVTILALVAILLFAKRYLTPSGKVTITLNGKEKISVDQGASLLSTLSENGVYLSSACGGKGSCGQCKCQVPEGGGEILDVEKGHFTRKQIKEHYRLGCQCKVKGDLSVTVPESVLGVKEWECEVISNKNVATFIKEFIVKLPEGEHMDFIPGSYAQIKIPTFSIDYDKDIDKASIGEEYLPAWQKFGLFDLKCQNTEETVRAYSMANYPAEGDRIMLIDKKGETIKSFSSEKYELAGSLYNEGYCPMMKGDKVVFLDKKGEESSDFSNSKMERGYCYGVNDGKTIYTDGDEFGIVDKSGEIGLRAKYENLTYASPNRYIAEDSDGKWGVITAEGEEIIPFDYASIVQMSTDKSHYFAFEDSDWILIDEKGEQVGTEEFSDFNPRTDAIDQFYSEANQDDEMDYSIDAPAQIEPEEYATDSVAVPVYDYDYAYYDEEVCSQ